MSSPTGISSTWFSRIRQTAASLRGRPDSEHEMSFNRLAFTAGILWYLATTHPDPQALGVLGSYCVISVAVFLSIALDSQVRMWRRVVMILLDMLALSFVMHVNGAYAAACFSVYLWVIFGNGFRFGKPYLYAAAATAIAAFATVIVTTDFWRDQLNLSIGLLIGLVILPAYAGSLIGKLSKAKREAEEASQAKSYFLASVSHELRTPLTAVIGLGSQLQSMDLTTEQRNMVGTMVSAGRSLLSLINQLLDFSRHQVEGAKIIVESFDLLDLLAEVRSLMQANAWGKELDVRLHVTPRTPQLLKGDEGHIREVLLNLVGNAIKFTERGSVTISADAEITSSGDMVLNLAVTDTGVGIAPEAQQHIFESFRQADQTIMDRFGGTGLGLAICKQLVGSMGGQIGVVSEPGQGSRFWFTTPVSDDSKLNDWIEGVQGARVVLLSADADLASMARAHLEPAECELLVVEESKAFRDLAGAGADARLAVIVDEQQLGRLAMCFDQLRELLPVGAMPVLFRRDDGPANGLEDRFGAIVSAGFEAEHLGRAIRVALSVGGKQASRIEKPTVEWRPVRILLADDNRINQKVFELILTRAGHQVEVVENGEAALEVMNDERVDIVLMDINMPVLNGIETTKLYRFTSLGRRRLPILAVTADSSERTMELCREAGMDACITKPVEAEHLLRMIDEFTAPADTDELLAKPDPKGVVQPLFVEATSAAPEDLPAIDWVAIEDLEELGGAQFLSELLEEFVTDSAGVLDAMRTSVATSNVESFRYGAHALRSASANVGAAKLAELGNQFQHISAPDFLARGETHLQALNQELDRVRTALASRHADTMAQTG